MQDIRMKSTNPYVSVSVVCDYADYWDMYEDNKVLDSVTYRRGGHRFRFEKYKNKIEVSVADCNAFAIDSAVINDSATLCYYEYCRVSKLCGTKPCSTEELWDCIVSGIMRDDTIDVERGDHNEEPESVPPELLEYLKLICEGKTE